jgi:hypothetical protein
MVTRGDSQVSVDPPPRIRGCRPPGRSRQPDCGRAGRERLPVPGSPRNTTPGVVNVPACARPTLLLARQLAVAAHQRTASSFCRLGPLPSTRWWAINPSNPLTAAAGRASTSKASRISGTTPERLCNLRCSERCWRLNNSAQLAGRGHLFETCGIPFGGSVPCLSAATGPISDSWRRPGANQARTHSSRPSGPDSELVATLAQITARSSSPSSPNAAPPNTLPHSVAARLRRRCVAEQS